MVEVTLASAIDAARSPTRTGVALEWAHGDRGVRPICSRVQVQCDVDPNFFLKYTDIRIGAPSVEEELIISKTTPQECR